MLGCGLRWSVEVEVVLNAEGVTAAATIAQSLQPLGGCRIMNEMEHGRQAEADRELKELKKQQASSAATGAAVSAINSLVSLRGEGGSPRKSV